MRIEHKGRKRILAVAWVTLVPLAFMVWAVREWGVPEGIEGALLPVGAFAFVIITLWLWDIGTS